MPVPRSSRSSSPLIFLSTANTTHTTGVYSAMTPAFHPGSQPLLRKRPRTSDYPLQGLTNRSYVLSNQTPFVRAQSYRMVL